MAVTWRICGWPKAIAPRGIPNASFVCWTAKSPSPDVRTSAVGNGGNLFSECHSERFSLPSQVRPIAWSADEKYLATVERIRRYNICVNIWDVTSRQRKTSLQGCPGWIESISWSPDGKYLAAGNDRSTVVIWEIASGKRVQALYGHAATINSVDWNPDSVRLASGGADGTVRIWNAHTAKTLTVLVVASGPVWRVDWHPDGKHLLATFAEDRGTSGAKIWDTTSGQETHGESLGYGEVCGVQPGRHSRRIPTRRLGFENT